MDVSPALVADREAPEAGEPGERALDHPAVAPEAVRALDAAAGDARRDRAGAALGPAAAVVVGLVRVELAGAASRAAPTPTDTGHDVEHRGEQLAVMAVRPAQLEAERRAARVDDEVALRARPPAIRGVRADLRGRRRAPPFAGMDAARRSTPGSSRAHPLRPAAPRAPGAARPARPRRACPPAGASKACLGRRSRVMPAQPNASRSSRSQPMPDHEPRRRCPPGPSPSRARRSQHRGRPPFGFGGSGGSNGATPAHSSSLTRGSVITPDAARPDGLR